MRPLPPAIAHFSPPARPRARPAPPARVHITSPVRHQTLLRVISVFAALFFFFPAAFRVRARTPLLPVPALAGACLCRGLRAPRRAAARRFVVRRTQREGRGRKKKEEEEARREGERERQGEDVSGEEGYWMLAKWRLADASCQFHRGLNGGQGCTLASTALKEEEEEGEEEGEERRTTDWPTGVVAVFPCASCLNASCSWERRAKASKPKNESIRKRWRWWGHWRSFVPVVCACCCQFSVIDSLYLRK